MKSIFALFVCVAVALAGAMGASASDDILIADFEGPDYGDWKVTGDAFGDGPAQGTLPKQGNVNGYEGKGLVNTYLDRDKSRGTLTSPKFTIERNHINFLMCGGAWIDRTAMHLLVKGKAVRKAAGENKDRSGSETLRWMSWDVSEFIGKKARLMIVDDTRMGWGHLSVDHIVQSDKVFISERTREMLASKRFLNLPVNNKNAKTWIRLKRGDDILREFDIKLAHDKDDVDFWVTLDLSEFKGETLTLWADNIGRTSEALDLATQADELIGGENLYQEVYRPQIHFSPMRGWNNDPNGMMYYDGEYHLFFQHNPYGWGWGNMTWGHAVSTDLVHWEEIGDAIHPDEYGTIFSGSGVVDWNNTTGFQTGDDPPLICIFTYAGGNNLSSKGVKFTQGIAYSNDRGRTWTKYDGNPVLGHINGGNRDPKVIWHTPTDQWVIVLYLDDSRMGFFTSPDLKTWTMTSELKNFHECPEFFELPIDGDESKMKWVLYGAAGDYLLGEFDGEKFVPDGDALKFNYGNCFYASQTFSDIPKEDGRRIQIGWGTIGHPDMPFNQMMDFPVVLALRATGEGPCLYAEPVKEIELLYTRSETVGAMTLDTASKTIAQGELFDIAAAFEPGGASEVGFTVRGLAITYDVKKQELRCKDKAAPLSPENGRVELRLLVDRLSVEIFANDGRIYMPIGHVFDGKNVDIGVFAKNGEATLTELTVHELVSAWEQSKQGAYAGTGK